MNEGPLVTIAFNGLYGGFDSGFPQRLRAEEDDQFKTFSVVDVSGGSR